MDAGEYMYYMGAFMTFTVWMLFVSYRDVPKLYLMRSVQESVFMLFCKMEAVFQVQINKNSGGCFVFEGCLQTDYWD